MTYLLARVENFSRFNGENLAADPVMGYGKSGEVPHEIYNFSVATDGFIYGYLPKDGGGDLTRLGGNSESESVNHVTVIFISSGVLCGYYRSATVFSSMNRHPDHLMAGKNKIFYRVKVEPKNAFLISVDNRKNYLNPKPKGMFPVLYGNENSPWVIWFENLIEGIQTSLVSERKRKKWALKVERRSKYRDIALKKYGLNCECCGLSHVDSIRSAVFEVHHKKAYADSFEMRRLEVDDLAVLCANCHRMIHKMPSLVDIEDLKKYLK